MITKLVPIFLDPSDRRGNAMEFDEYRCSKCGQIGGDSDNGAYDGCPKGGKHDTSGGTV